ncbi:GspH/FimT family pseudopilin [Comamonas sp. GB3 AK4-5]|uniref:GspH/FimT family pseudopilin n=1 Tax=Comamonas sp. GB3 AK4-5 TaxID=3231487 RepID=UPI00351E8501
MRGPYFLAGHFRYAGFTLVELLLTVFILSLCLLLAAPALQEFFVKIKLRRIADDFAQTVFKARNTAVGKNVCTTMCISSSVDKDLPACGSKGDADWQPGWMLFLNPSCDANKNTPDALQDIIELRMGWSEEYYLQSQSGVKKINFNARGGNAIANASEFDIYYRSAGNALNDKYGLNICLDALGRVRTIPSSRSCNNYK